MKCNVSPSADHRAEAQGAVSTSGILFSLALSVPKAVFPINCQGIDIRKQPAFGLGEVQLDRSRLAPGRQKLPDIVHMRARLVVRWKLLQRDQRRCQGLGDNPFVVPGNSLSWHSELHPANSAIKAPR